MTPIGKIAEVISSGIKYLTLLHKTAPIRKMKKAIEAGEKYIQVNQKSGEFKDISTAGQIKLLRHYAKKFFRYN